MDFELSETRLALQRSAREFAEQELLPGVRERDATSAFPVEAYKKMGKLGFIGVPYPKEYGGQGCDSLTYIMCFVLRRFQK